MHRLQAHLIFALFDSKDVFAQPLISTRNMKWTFTCFLPVHGGWGEWSNHWSECSTTCGLGMRTRERECDNPKPKYGGRPCEEQERQQVKYCRERDCDPGLILRLLLLSFYCMFVAAFPLAEFLCFHTGIKMTIAQLA